MKVRHLRAFAAGVFTAVSLGAVATHAEGIYVGGSLGSQNYQDSVNGISGSSSSMSGKVFGGYQLTPNFALETGVVRLGRLDDGFGDKVNGRGVFFDAVGSAPPSEQWSLLGRLGAAHVDLDTSGGDSSGSGLKLGLGAQYSPTGNVALRGEWERYRPSIFGDRPNIDQYTIGVRIGF